MKQRLNRSTFLLAAVVSLCIHSPLPALSHPVSQGMATWYGAQLAGKKTASGEKFNPRELTAAHRSLRFGTRVRVTNIRNGRSVVVRINDRHRNRNIVIDLSRRAAQTIGLISMGKAPVRLEVLSR